MSLYKAVIDLNYLCYLIKLTSVLALCSENNGVIQDKTRVLVTVEPEGFVAIPDVSDRPYIIFNIGNLAWYCL